MGGKKEARCVSTLCCIFSDLGGFQEKCRVSGLVVFQSGVISERVNYVPMYYRCVLVSCGLSPLLCRMNIHDPRTLYTMQQGGRDVIK